ncbi:sodium:solute symporter family protein [Maribacter sp. CXY002]|uniref:sodium:solute symporter family protein n=1 Tax=Maribacter luteocoastalis TaxID=3407671 RepID=UPI003B682541
MDYFFEHYVTLILTTIYVGGCLYIGWFFKKKASQGVEGFYVAKREIPGWVISLAFFSTSASTNTYIGQAGKSFEYGLSWAWMGLIWTFFCIISWQLLGPKMRFQTARLKSFTIPDYFHLRYKSNLAKSIRVLSAVIILFATLWYMIGIAKGCAHVLTAVLDIPYEYGSFAIIAVTCAYTIWGGMYSVLWTDALQGIIMFGVAILMLAIPFVYVGGVDQLFEAISTTEHLTKSGTPIKSGLVTFGELVSFLYIIGIGLAVGMKQISEPKNLIRFYSINNAKSMRFAMIWTPVFLGISLVCVMGLGALVHGMASIDEANYLINHTDEVVGFMLDKFDNKLVSGICVAGLFAAGMSSLASVIIIIGTAFVKDIWHVAKPMEESKIIPRTKWFMGIYCVIVFLMTLYPMAGIVELTAFAGAVFAASFFPAIFGGLYLKWGTDLGAMASMIMGMLTNIVWRFVFRFNYDALKDIHEVIPAFIIAMLTYIIVSLLSKNRQPDAAHLANLFDVKN